jgi:diguanylate cyclase (GGDEF)-like protein
MNLLLLPDFFAMALLVAVLLMVRGREDRAIMRLWITALFLILLECAAHIVYTMKNVGMPIQRAAHIVALESYLLAGAVFLRSAATQLRRMPASYTFLAVNLVPHVALLGIYGADVRMAWLYHLFIGLGITTAVISSAILRRSWRYYAAFAVLWIPLVITANVMEYRTSIYISLCFLYMLCAGAFTLSLPKSSRGKIAVVSGFFLWSLCFLTHPWVSSGHPEWTDFAGAVWNMQKFIITVGLLLVLLERQIRSNEWLALHDDLTGLPNRRLFDDRIQQALARADRDGHRVALFNLDLDGFKGINDSFGHDAGDTLLRSVAHNLEAVLRRTDTLARLGGDEFSVIAVDIGGAPMASRLGMAADNEAHPVMLPQIQRILSTMVQAVEQPVNLGPVYKDAVVSISASVGVSVFPDDGRDWYALMRTADKRMYERKAANAEVSAMAAERPRSLRRV